MNNLAYFDFQMLYIEWTSSLSASDYLTGIVLIAHNFLATVAFIFLNISLSTLNPFAPNIFS